MKKLLYFSAVWCGPCTMLNPVLTEICGLHNIPLEKIDVDKDIENTTKYHIRSIPTLIIIENDKEIKRHIGLINQHKIIEFWNN